MGACVYGVGACVYGNPMILVSAQVPLVLGLGLRVWGLGLTIFPILMPRGPSEISFPLVFQRGQRNITPKFGQRNINVPYPIPTLPSLLHLFSFYETFP